MESTSLVVKVGSLLGEEVGMAVTVHVPDDLAVGGAVDAPIVFAYPGGGYSRGYFDLRHGDDASYSQALHHTRAGVVVVACDHLGVGDSSLPPPELLTFEVLAHANAATADAVLSGLRSGSLVDGLPGLAPRAVIGIGQSLGGSVLTALQARHAPFDAVALLGWSGLHTVLPTPDGSARQVGAGGRGTTLREREQLAQIEALGDLVFPFHWDDVPDALVAKDMGTGFPVRADPVPAWASNTMPGAAASMLGPGVVADDAAAITVPVLVAVGERDVCPDPRREPTAYASSGDIGVVIVPTMAHMHNFASTRALLWDRLVSWYRTVSPATTSG